MIEKQENEETLLPVLTPSNQDLIKEETVNKDETESLLVKERNDTQEKTHLEKIFKRLGNELENSNKKKLSKIYKKYIASEKTLNRKIRKKSGKGLLCFMFQILLPLMEIINLIGIFTIISIMNCCFTLLVNSVKSYFGFGGEYNLYFYKEFYDQSMSESIDFNVMFFMSFLGDFLLKFSGFVSASFIFLLINFGSFFMIDSFNFINNIESENKEGEEHKVIEKYNIFNIVYILIFYLLLFVGVGGSSMLSQQILVDSHEKLERYNKKMKKIKKLEEKMRKMNKDPLMMSLTLYNDSDDDNEDKEIDLDNENKNKDKKEIKDEKSDNDKNKEIIEEQIDNDNIKNIDETKADKNENDNINKIDKNILDKIEEVGDINVKEEKDKEKDGKIKKKIKDKVERKTEGKFDYFFMVCITTIIGYFGKYYFCSILGYQLFDSENNINYRYFYYYVMIVYAACIILSILIYGLFSFIFRSPKKKDEDEKNKKNQKEDSYAVYQIFGFTIYKETINTDNEPKRNNFCLCCESIKNCCDHIVCYTNCNFFFCNNCKGDDKPYCCCCCCCPEYNEEDYTPNQFLFCFFYQGKRKQKWLHSFLVNKTQEELIPYMTQYIFLQLFVIGFNKAYDERESNSSLDDNLNFLKVFIISFCLFFYITITFSYFSSDYIKYGEDDKKESDGNKDKKNEENGKQNEENKDGKKEDEKIEEKKEDEKIEEKKEDEKIKEKKEEEKIEVKKDEQKNKEEEKEKMQKKNSILRFRSEKSGNTKTSAISQNILNGTIGILLVNGLYSFILSAIYLSKKYDVEELEKEMQNDYFIIVPVLLNKFYYFTLIYFCLSYTEKKKSLELISGATLISLYVTAFNFITNFIYYFGSKGLLIFQIIFSSVIALFWLFIIISMIVISIKNKTIRLVTRNLFLFLCRFFLICFVLLFLDENMNCCCCDLDLEEDKKKEKEEEKDKIKVEQDEQIEGNKVKEESQEKEGEKIDEIKENKEEENKIKENNE